MEAPSSLLSYKKQNEFKFLVKKHVINDFSTCNFLGEINTNDYFIVKNGAVLCFYTK